MKTLPRSAATVRIRCSRRRAASSLRSGQRQNAHAAGRAFQTYLSICDTSAPIGPLGRPVPRASSIKSSTWSSSCDRTFIQRTASSPPRSVFSFANSPSMRRRFAPLPALRNARSYSWRLSVAVATHCHPDPKGVWAQCARGSDARAMNFDWSGPKGKCGPGPSLGAMSVSPPLASSASSSHIAAAATGVMVASRSSPARLLASMDAAT